jgi:hypothetical protein
MTRTGAIELINPSSLVPFRQLSASIGGNSSSSWRVPATASLSPRASTLVWRFSARLARYLVIDPRLKKHIANTSTHVLAARVAGMSVAASLRIGHESQSNAELRNS